MLSFKRKQETNLIFFLAAIHITPHSICVMKLWKSYCTFSLKLNVINKALQTNTYKSEVSTSEPC